MRFPLFLAELAFAVLAASLLVLYPLSSHLRGGDQVMAHDAQLPASAARVAEQFEVLKPINGGLLQGIAPPIAFTTAIFYGAAFQLGMKPGSAQVVGMTFLFALTLWLAASGFDRLLADWGRARTAGRKVDACLLGALYIVAPFTLIYMSYGIFWSFNIALAIGFMPLLFHLFLRNFVEGRERFEWRSLCGLALCLSVVVWSVLFLLPTFIILAAFLAMRGGFGKQDFKKALVLGALVLAGSLPSLYGMYLSAFNAGWRAAADPVSANAAFESIQGGVLTGFMQYAAWPIYTLWSPRLVLGFVSHFTSAAYITLTTLLLLVAIAVPLVTDRKFLVNRYAYVAGMFLIVVFFTKGAGQPFGAAFRAVLSSVPGAGLIRTPDTKFGVFVILGLAAAIALALANTERNARWFRIVARVVILAVAAYHAIPMIDGEAILARDSELAPGQSGRGYAIALSPGEKRIIETLEREPSVGVVVLPPSFGLSSRREGDVFIYRNVVSDFLPNPLYYSGWNEAPNEGVKSVLRAGVTEGDWERLPEIGIGFVLVNRNVLEGKAVQQAVYRSVRQSPAAWSRVLDEGGYELYRLDDAHRKPLVALADDRGERGAKVVESGSWFVHFESGDLGPGMHTVSVRSAENRHWRLVEIPRGCASGAALCAVRGMLSAHSDDSIVRDGERSELANRWRVERRSPAAARADSMMAVFVPQLWMFLFFGIALATALLCLFAWVNESPGKSGASQ